MYIYFLTFQATITYYQIDFGRMYQIFVSITHIFSTNAAFIVGDKMLTKAKGKMLIMTLTYDVDIICFMVDQVPQIKIRR